MSFQLTIDDLTDEVVQKAISVSLINERSVVPNAAINDISVNEEIVNQINSSIRKTFDFLETVKVR